VANRYQTHVRCHSRWAGPVLAAVLALAVSLPARAAEITYTIQRIFKIGDRVGDVNTRPNGISLQVLNDRGQILFGTLTADNPNGAAVQRYADGQFTPVFAAGGEGPLGVWPKDTVGRAPNSMDQAGNVVCSVMRWNGGDGIDLGTFLWDAQTGKATPILMKGMPATSSLTFEGGNWSPVLNNRGEIAFPGWGQDKPNHFWAGIFLREADGNAQPVVLTDQKMPDGRKLADVWQPSLNDAGVITFLGAAASDNEASAYLWENGTITPVAVLGMDAPEGGKIRDVRAALLNNKIRSVLVLASRSAEGRLGLYRFAAGKLTALVVPDQTLTDGGKFSDIVLGYYGVSNANELGQHAFLARLADGSTAAYLLDVDGKPSLILKSGAVTDLGKITLIGTATRPSGGLISWGSGIGLNSKGQVALTVSIDGGPTTLVLLTPGALAPGG
jgi:hypothetical protein